MATEAVVLVFFFYCCCCFCVPSEGYTRKGAEETSFLADGPRAGDM
jgi:hypothetical protein